MSGKQMAPKTHDKDAMVESVEGYDRCVAYRVQDDGHKIVCYSNADVVDHVYQREFYNVLNCLDKGYVVYRANNVPKKFDGDMKQSNQVTLISVGRVSCDW